MALAIYGLNMSVNGADHPAYYSISLSSGAVGAGSFSCTPAETQYTYVSFEGGITFQIPGGVASAGAAATTTNDLIAGNVYVSPAIEVPVQIALYYQGKIIQAYEVPAGQTQGSFSWNVPSSRESVPEPKSVLDGMIAPPTRPK